MKEKQHGNSFSTRLRVWIEARRSAGDEWTPKRFESVTGIARVYWSYWIRADERLARGEKVVLCHTQPTIKQLAKALAAMETACPAFGLAFKMPSPQPLIIRDSRHYCLYCGETLLGRERYCNDWCYALGKVKQRQARRHERQQRAAG
jgi:hypothetical protein